MEITWQVVDGYCGGVRLQVTEVCDDELDECETCEEREKLINEYIQSDFENSITWARC